MATPWHAAFPTPSAKPGSISCAELLSWLQNPTPAPAFILIDLRRADHEGGAITGSINLPAQSLYPSIPTLYDIFHRSRITRIVWFCGSSRGRGSRAAAWFQDHLDSIGETGMTSMILEGGVRAWATGGVEYTARMVGYDAGVWQTEAKTAQ